MSDTTQDDLASTSIDIAADPEDIWEALTTSDGLAGWFGEGSVIGDEPGDSLFVVDPVADAPKTGLVETVVPEEQLDFTWWPLGEPDHASRVSITLRPIEIGTRVTVTERPLRPGAATMSNRGVVAMAGAGMQ